ncbi:MAG: T9SS type A sorting domain-containing protein, partial [FCB group bacterium]
TDTTYITQYYDHKENVTEAAPIVFSGNLTNINFALKKTPPTGNKLYGQVLTNAVGIPAQVISYNVFPTDTINGIQFEVRTFDASKSNGNFVFNNLSPGLYILLAVPLNENIVPGYFLAGGNAVASWANATLLNVQINSQVGPENINLNPVTPIAGRGIVSGIIQADSSIFVKRDQTPLAKEGISGAIVVTKDDKNNVRKYNISNIKGNFSMDSLTNGNYVLGVDKIGYAYSTTNFTISDSNNNVTEVVDLTKQKPTSVNELYNSKDGYILVYPNPAERNFTIEFNSLSEKADIKIYNLLGIVVLDTKFITGLGAVSIGFNNIKLTSGIYFVQITSGIKIYNIPVIIR